jgi:NAD(P)-dependent dehydrogenase (short-subunit alcohol dehydrogenase family)
MREQVGKGVCHHLSPLRGWRHLNPTLRPTARAPGAVDTPFSPKLAADGIFEGRDRVEKFLIKRYTACEEMAELVTFLCTPACACVTGTNCVIDGGYLAQ